MSVISLICQIRLVSFSGADLAGSAEVDSLSLVLIDVTMMQSVISAVCNCHLREIGSDSNLGDTHIL